MSPAQALAIVLPCLAGVAAAHKAGVIHRDLKPGNIFLCHAAEGRPEQPKVLDFGVSKLTNPGEASDATMTRPGMVLGTPQYMAPEQMRGERVDVRADVYAFGVILYELLSGVRPYNAQSFADLVLRVMTETPSPLDRVVPGLPPPLSAIVAHAMARDPQARCASAKELIAALEPYAALDLQPTAADRTPARSQPAPPSESLRAVERATIPPGPRSNRALLAGSVLGAGALVFALVAAWMAKPDPPIPAASPNRELRSAAVALPAPDVLPIVNPTPIADPAPADNAAVAAPNNATPASAESKDAVPSATSMPRKLRKTVPTRPRSAPRKPDRMDEFLRDDALIDPFAK